MTASRLVLAALAVVGTASAAESPVDQTVAQAAARAEQKAAQAPQPLALEFRLRAALALRERYPELSRGFLDTTLAELRGGKDWVLGADGLQALVELSPADAVAILPYLHAKNPYSFPVALDPGRKVNAAFSVEGIPKSFIFDRQGRLAAHAIVCGPSRSSSNC